MEQEFNLSFYFDHNLREIPDSPDEMSMAVDHWIRQLGSITDHKKKLTWMGQLGVYCRILRRLDLAENYLKEAIWMNRQKEPEDKWDIVLKIRLGHVHQWQKKYQEADRLFLEVIALIGDKKEFEDLVDFVWQHYGKSLFDQGEYPHALKCFKKALELRFKKGDKQLIQSAKIAISETYRRISARTSLLH